MGGEIIADKFALLKTRGNNGVAFTHIVEDTLLGERAVVKVSDAMGPLALEYLKTVNLAREMDIPGILMPFEGGILEEESGYYLAFPEVGEPSLENYLRIGIPLTCAEALAIIQQILNILEGLHGAGFCHLFIDTRNIFYRSGGRVTLKDPALRTEFFHPLLELVAAPDFSYLSPEVMDGGVLGAEADVYALGRLAERLLGEAVDAKTSPWARTLQWVDGECRRGGAAGDNRLAGIKRNILQDTAQLVDGEDICSSYGDKRHDAGDAGEFANISGIMRDKTVRKLRARRFEKMAGRGRSRAQARLATSLGFTAILVLGLLFALGLGGDADRATIAGSGGGSAVGLEAASELGENEGLEGDARLRTVDDQSQAVEISHQETAPVLEAGGGEEGRTQATPAPAAPALEVTQAPLERSPASPLADFSLSPAQGQSPLQVFLDASSSYDPDGSIVSYSWSFGGRGPALFHVFESNIIPANIAVTLTVTDDGGHSSTTTRHVTLY